MTELPVFRVRTADRDTHTGQHSSSTAGDRQRDNDSPRSRSKPGATAVVAVITLHCPEEKEKREERRFDSFWLQLRSGQTKMAAAGNKPDPLREASLPKEDKDGKAKMDIAADDEEEEEEVGHGVVWFGVVWDILCFVLSRLGVPVSEVGGLLPRSCTRCILYNRLCGRIIHSSMICSGREIYTNNQ